MCTRKLASTYSFLIRSICYFYWKKHTHIRNSHSNSNWWLSMKVKIICWISKIRLNNVIKSKLIEFLGNLNTIYICSYIWCDAQKWWWWARKCISKKFLWFSKKRFLLYYFSDFEMLIFLSFLLRIHNLLWVFLYTFSEKGLCVAVGRMVDMRCRMIYDIYEIEM